MICLANLAEKSEQEVFDWVVTNLMKQGKKSVDSGGLCLYRGKDNCKCAAGWLISDSEYKKEFEGCGWNTLSKNNLIPTAHFYIIMELQNIHDDYTVDNWVGEFLNMASERDFTLPECLK